ncbi:MAG: EAL domain-containing protein [Pseudomonadota bacterium]
MTLRTAFTTLAEYNAAKANDLEKALLQSGTLPISASALLAHLQGTPRLKFNFEKAHALHPDVPIQFAEALFILMGQDGQQIPSVDVLRALKTLGSDKERLDSRFRFYMGMSAADEFFRTHPNHSHMSINIPADAVASRFFLPKLTEAVDLFRAAHPGKGLILEMLEDKSWDKQTHGKAMADIAKLGVGWAVDDYGAYNGHHTINSLRLVKRYAGDMPPIVKIDGHLLERSLNSGKMIPVIATLQNVQKHCPEALLVFEWIKNDGQIAVLQTAMDNAGLSKLSIDYVQGKHFRQAQPCVL